VGVNKPSWTPEKILVALRDYAAEFGKPPAKQELEWPPTGYPSARTVRRHFSSFTAGLKAARSNSRIASMIASSLQRFSRGFRPKQTSGPALRTGPWPVRIGPRRAPSTSASEVGRPSWTRR